MESIREKVLKDLTGYGITPEDMERLIDTLITTIREDFKASVLEKREALAEIEHEQWIAWSKNIAETESITPARRERWEKLWRPYAELTEAEKDQDREWADKTLEAITNI